MVTKNKPDSICWGCARACQKTCSWSDEFIPVDGWTAEYTEKTKSYLVIECPMFVPDSKESRCIDMDERGAMLLMQKVLELVREDYMMLPSLQPQLDKWIRKYGAKLCMFEDPEGVIKRLKREYTEYAKRKATRSMIRGGRYD